MFISMYVCLNKNQKKYDCITSLTEVYVYTYSRRINTRTQPMIYDESAIALLIKTHRK